jgi:hypothetical protein
MRGVLVPWYLLSNSRGMLEFGNFLMIGNVKDEIKKLVNPKLRLKFVIYPPNVFM